jgi:hypothetical protein
VRNLLLAWVPTLPIAILLSASFHYVFVTFFGSSLATSQPA